MVATHEILKKKNDIFTMALVKIYPTLSLFILSGTSTQLVVYLSKNKYAKTTIILKQEMFKKNIDFGEEVK